MSTFLYNSARSSFATGGLNWPAAAVHAVLLNSAYAPQPSHQTLADIPAGARVIDATLTGLGQVSGVCYGVIPQFNAFLNAATVVALCLYIKGATDVLSPLIYYSADGRGFPFTPAGFNYAVGFDQASGGFFQV